MRSIHFLLIVTVALIALAGCDNERRTTVVKPADSGVGSSTTDTSKEIPPDNTAINERDTTPIAKTPIDQDENPQDVRITAEIRKQVLEVEGMSINARNCKIITSKGQVTLRGPVNSSGERDAIERIAHNVAGRDNVDNQLDVLRR